MKKILQLQDIKQNMIMNCGPFMGSDLDLPEDEYEDEIWTTVIEVKKSLENNIYDAVSAIQKPPNFKVATEW